MRTSCAVVLGVLLTCLSCICYGADLSFIDRPMTAGNALLSENGFQITRILGQADFAPEIRLPIQLVYRSNRERSGLFGFAWYSPQLESSARGEKDGVLWTTPWGETIKFFPKKAPEPKGAVKVALFEEAKKGRGFYAPYADWEANTSKKDYRLSGDWTFTGKRDKKGWKMVYRDTRLQSITAPTGITVYFTYSKNLLTAVKCGDVPFVTLQYSGSRVSQLSINGVPHHLLYSESALRILPKTEQGNQTVTKAVKLYRLQCAQLEPQLFRYDTDGLLTEIRCGKEAEQFQVEHQTLAQRKAELAARRDRKQKYQGPIQGRLLADRLYQYTYAGPAPGSVTLTNPLKQTANYDYDSRGGVFRMTEFSGKSFTIYYFMRFDVAYLGKVRKIVDGRGRDVVSYRYDRMTGNVTRVRDMAGNDINYEYNRNGKVELISRRAANQNVPEPLTAFQYDGSGDPSEISVLDDRGRPVRSTRMTWRNRRLHSLSDGRQGVRIAYSKAGYPETVENDFRQISKRSYDQYNRLVATTDVYGVVTSYAFNEAGRIAKIERKAGKTLLTSLVIGYDAFGQPESYTDQAGRVKRFERDGFGRVVKEFFPDQTLVEYTYNALGQLHTVTDQNRHTISFQWNKFGLDARQTPMGQLTDYVHDANGLLSRTEARQGNDVARTVAYEYDKFDRPVKITYDAHDVETRTYDSWGRVLTIDRGARKATFAYDYFGRLIRKTDGDTETTYTYNPWGQRTGRITKQGDKTLTETRSYDKFGRLNKIEADGKTILYEYNDKNQLETQTINGVPIHYEYTPYGQLQSKTMGGGPTPLSSLKYLYAPDGTITGRVVDGKFQMYSYDLRGQLLRVADMQGNAAEQYAYDPAGNILSKTVNGKTTTYTYDKANQLVTSTCDGKTTHYRYDAAGRLVQEGDKKYLYRYLDKVASVWKNGRQLANFDYFVDGQVAKATYGAAMEEFLWDDLALIRRGGTTFLNEPYITGGNPVMANDAVMFNDMLGNTLGIQNATGFAPVAMTAFGETADASAFFTGKPNIPELGYAFLFRNYRADQGKWQTVDPLGYPDGWNNFAYGNNQAAMGFDSEGGKWGNIDFVAYYYRLSGPNWLDTDNMGLTGDVWDVITGTHDIVNKVKAQIDDLVKNNVKNTSVSSGNSSTTYYTARGYDFGSVCYSMGGGTVSTWSIISYSWNEYTINDVLYRGYSWAANITADYSDIFMDPLDIGIEIGNAYGYGHTWKNITHNGFGTVKLE